MTETKKPKDQEPGALAKIVRLAEMQAAAGEAEDQLEQDDQDFESDEDGAQETDGRPPIEADHRPVLPSYRTDDSDIDDIPPEQLRRSHHPDSTARQRRPVDWEVRCPVKALGVNNGTLYFLDPRGQIRDLKAGELGQSHLDVLFGSSQGVLDHWWPRFDKDTNWVGCKYERIRGDLIEAAFHQGIFTPWGRVRGVGAWCGDDGELILHLGDRIWRGPHPEGHREATTFKPSRLGKYVYAAGEAQPMPIFDKEPERLCEATKALFSIFKQWSWRREIDPRLLLGWIGAAMIGGALDWRPAVWLSGDAGTGKSTLQKVISRLFDNGIVQSSDATGAGIWQVVGMSSLPVAIDEIEPGDSDYKTKAIIDLARQAASGALILRGGQDHSGHQFRAQSAFIFSSILRPPMGQADLSRLAILELGPQRPGQILPDISAERLKRIAAHIRGRLIQIWPKLMQALELYRIGLAAVGHKARGADVFGTLLAISYLLQTDEPLSPDLVAEHCSLMKATELAETSEQLANWQEMLLRLTSTQVAVYKSGNKVTIGKMISQVREALPEEQTGKQVNDELAGYGLRVYRPDELTDLNGTMLDGWWLAIANKTHTTLGTLFRETDWRAGGWMQAATNVPGSQKVKGPLKFDGQNHRVTLLPLDLVSDPTGYSPSPPDNGPQEDRQSSGGWYGGEQPPYSASAFDLGDDP